MQKNQNQQAKQAIMKPDFAGTNPQQVKKEIQKDVNAGQGDITAREAGGMQD